MGIMNVELGIPFTGWPLRLGMDYEFGLDILDADLVDRIIHWARDFNREFDEETGWSSEEARERHRAEGAALREKVQQQLGPQYEVSLNPLGSGLVNPWHRERN